MVGEGLFFFRHHGQDLVRLPEPNPFFFSDFDRKCRTSNSRYENNNNNNIAYPRNHVDIFVNSWDIIIIFSSVFIIDLSFLMVFVQIRNECNINIINKLLSGWSAQFWWTVLRQWVEKKLMTTGHNLILCFADTPVCRCSVVVWRFISVAGCISQSICFSFRNVLTCCLLVIKTSDDRYNRNTTQNVKYEMYLFTKASIHSWP